MIIKELNIKNFGKLHDTDISLSPGINVVYGPNESGKTTLHTFLKAMFFGLVRQRGRASRNDTYSRYEPWDSEGGYGGTLWFQCEGRSFRLTRNFQKGNSQAELVCQDDGEILSIEDGDLDALLGNISEAVYENTVSIAQLKSATNQGLVQELQNYMASYQGSADAAIDLNRAMQALKMWRKGYQVQVERSREDLERDQENLLGRMAYLKKEVSDLREQQYQAVDQGSALGIPSPEEDNGEEEIRQPEIVTIYDRRIARIKKKKILTTILSLLLLAAGASCVILLPAIWKIAAGAGCALLELFLALYMTKLGREQNKNNRLRARRLQKQDKLRWNIERLTQELKEKETTLENLRSTYEECEEESLKPLPEEMDIESLNLAMDTITRISASLHNRIGESLRSRTSEILSEITEGRYTQVYMNENLEITVHTKERSIPLERLSRGTVEQIYFALRMAVGDILCKEEEMPIVLDDVFAMYDEERLGAVLRWLEQSGRQVIITTCHTREIQLLDKLGILYFEHQLGQHK